jgi:hypothetical protein
MRTPPDPDRFDSAGFESAARWRPARFTERGVSLPFTTPFLLGGRMRPAERGGAELVLAHPAGAGGVCVLPWSAMPGFCAPTLHDRALWERAAAAAAPEISPAAARRAARAVAVAGHAGRAAARAAAEAEAARHEAVTALHYGLLLGLLRRTGPAGAGAPAEPPPLGDRSLDIERRIPSALDRLRREGGPPPAAAMAALGEIASVLEECGPRGGPCGGGGHAQARLPRLLAGIAGMAEEMEAAAERASLDEARRAGLRLLAESAGLALRCGRAALDAAHALLDDLWALLRRWPEEGQDVIRRLSRPEWLLDGWDAIHGLWRSAGGDALHDMAPLVPAMPTEADGWVGFDAAGRMEASREALRRWRRAAPPPPDASADAGRNAVLTARNEALRVLCP